MSALSLSLDGSSVITRPGAGKRSRGLTCCPAIAPLPKNLARVSLSPPPSPETRLPRTSASSMAAALDLDFALFHKERKKANEIARMVLVGNVENKVAILIDDMADTCGTLALAAKHLLNGGAKSVLALVTHGILSGPAMKVLNESKIEKLIVTNSIPQEKHKKGCDRVREIDVSHVLAEAVRRSHFGESVSVLFNSVPVVSSPSPFFSSREHEPIPLVFLCVPSPLFRLFKTISTPFRLNRDRLRPHRVLNNPFCLASRSDKNPKRRSEADNRTTPRSRVTHPPKTPTTRGRLEKTSTRSFSTLPLDSFIQPSLDICSHSTIKRHPLYLSVSFSSGNSLLCAIR